jgi:hypothetical protein
MGAFLQEPDQVRPGHAENLRRFSCGELSFQGHHPYGHPLEEGFQDLPEKVFQFRSHGQGNLSQAYLLTWGQVFEEEANLPPCFLLGEDESCHIQGQDTT